MEPLSVPAKHARLPDLLNGSSFRVATPASKVGVFARDNSSVSRKNIGPNWDWVKPFEHHKDC